MNCKQQVDLGGLCPEWAQDFLTRHSGISRKHFLHFCNYFF